MARQDTAPLRFATLIRVSTDQQETQNHVAATNSVSDDGVGGGPPYPSGIALAHTCSKLSK